MNVKRNSRRLLKLAGILAGALLAVAIAFHFWFVNHAEELIEGLVSAQSNGKVKLNVKKFKFNWFSRKMELVDAVFFSTDTATAPTAYRFKVDRLRIEVKALLPLLFEKRILIDSLHLINPDISVTRLRSVKRDSLSADADNDLSIPREMGKIYNSIQDALNVLKVTRFQIDNGRFALYNQIRPQDTPVIITNLDFNIDNLQVADSSSGNAPKLFFSDNISLRTRHQDILFPDGKHRLSFSNFRIDILKRLVEFDSCTITAERADSSMNSFRVFFDKLRLTNIDFDTLYHSEVIKADSVYCFRPRFRLDVQLDKRSDSAKAPPKLNDIIRQVTGDIQLAYVIVEDGSFDINTMREGRPSSFTSEHNNFEVKGLHIRKKAKRPLTVEGFRMGIRNFENFLRDSSYAIQFDSILFNNDRISLSNFSYAELDNNNRPINTLTMPQFELQGLSWDTLVLEQQLKAERVTLFRPTISYNVNQGRRSHARDIFQVLAGVGDIMQLNQVNIIDGEVNLFFRNNNQLRLSNATLSVKGEQLVSSQQLKNIQQSVNELSFRKGYLKMGDLEASLGQVSFTGHDNRLQAGQLDLKYRNQVQLAANGVLIRSLIVDDVLQHTAIDGISWNNARVQLDMANTGRKKRSDGFTVRNVAGDNTAVDYTNGQRRLAVHLQHLEASEFSTTSAENMVLKGFAAKGQGLQLQDTGRLIRVASFDIRDKQRSTMQQLTLTSRNPADSLYAIIPSLTITPDISSILSGKLQAAELVINQPKVRLRHIASEQGKDPDAIFAFPEGYIGRLLIRQPDLLLEQQTEKGPALLEWKDQSAGSFIELNELRLTAKTLSGHMRFLLNGFTYTTPRGKKFSTGAGQISGRMDQLSVIQHGQEEAEWKGTIAQLSIDHLQLDSLGKKNGQLFIEQAGLSQLTLHSAWLPRFRDIITHNKQFRLTGVTGYYHNAADQFSWFNAGYDKSSRLFTLDSFFYRPAQDEKAFMAAQSFQKDYITAQTGTLTVGPLDVDRYISDTVLELGVILLKDGKLSSFRDKRLPFPSGMVRELPVNLLKKIPVKVMADSIYVSNAHVDYIELNEKTHATGRIAVSELNAKVTQVRNFDLQPQDSLNILATGTIENILHTTLQVKESYTDTLSGFLMKVQIGPADLTRLNHVLAPLASAELRSGYLDTLTMQVAGNEYLAFGKMNMYYHDLRVRLLARGEQGRRSLFSGIKTLLANSLVVRRKNTDRTGAVFFERLRERSAINYLVKILLNGVTSSVGAKSNRKLIRQYRQEVQRRGLPPVEAFPED